MPTDPDKYARLICPKHGEVYLHEAQYLAQLDSPNDPWVCPTMDDVGSCMRSCRFDDDYYEAQHLPPLPSYTFEEAAALLATCQRDEITSDVIAERMLSWQKEGEELAVGYVDDEDEFSISIGCSEFDGDEAKKLATLGTPGSIDNVFDESPPQPTSHVDRAIDALSKSSLKTVKVETLTKLQYHRDNPDVPDFPCFLYLYRKDGYHNGKIILENDLDLAAVMAGGIRIAIASKLEVMLTDGMDFVMFHSKDGKVLYPPDGVPVTRPEPTDAT